jgi:ribosomal protein S18 acetylase RimI-like enzyme
MACDVRTLGPGDEKALLAFLEASYETSMTMIGNLIVGGLEDRGEAHQATYVAAYEGSEIAAALAHLWNGMLLPQAPDHLAPLLIAVMTETGRFVRGATGPAAQVERILALLGLPRAPCPDVLIDERQGLFRLDLTGRARWRRPADPGGERDEVGPAWLAEQRDVEELVRARVAFMVETLGRTDDDELRGECLASVRLHLEERTLWIVEEAGDVLAMSAFLTALPEAVLMGGVYTRPSRRGRGLARRALEASLDAARRRGVRSALLSVADTNAPAVRLYESLGFRRVDDFHTYLLRATSFPMDE